LRTLMKRCKDATEEAGRELPMLFLVATDSCVVMGAYTPMLWRPSGAEYVQRAAGFEESCVFVVQCQRDSDGDTDDRHGSPEPLLTRTVAPMSCFRWTGANEQLFSLGTHGLLVGSDMPAIAVDADLTHGSTSACATFGSPPLCSALVGDGGAVGCGELGGVQHFRIVALEVLALVPAC